MRLFLMRHGLAIDRDDPVCPADPDRRLTSVGLEKTREAARGLKALGVAPDLILSSPYLRAAETAEIVARALDLTAREIQWSEALLPGANPGEIFVEVAASGARRALCVGHLPHLGLAAALAIGAPGAVIEIKKAGLLELDMDSLDPPHGDLVALIPPKTLRRMRA